MDEENIVEIPQEDTKEEQPSQK